MRPSSERKRNDRIYQPKKIRIPLKYHQSENLKRMIEIENSPYRFTNLLDMGILGDKVGAGKSLSILSLIAEKPVCSFKKGDRMRYPNIHIAPPEFIPTQFINSNLIIVPHNIFNQWKIYLEKQTTLSFLPIGTRKVIPDEIKKFDRFDVILCKNTMIKHLIERHPTMNCVIYQQPLSNTVTQLYNKHNISSFVKNLQNTIKTIEEEYKRPVRIRENMVNRLTDQMLTFSRNFNATAFKNDAKTITAQHRHANFAIWKTSTKGIIWNRVIIDEAHGIKLNTILRGAFNWFITSSLTTLTERFDWHIQSSRMRFIFYKNFRLSIHDYNETKREQFKKSFCIKNSEEVIEQSFKLPSPIYHYIECYTPLNVRILNGVLDPKILECLAADNVEQAITKMGCDVKNEGNVIKIACMDIKTKISKYELDVKNKSNFIREIEQQYLSTDDLKVKVGIHRQLLSVRNQKTKLLEKIKRLHAQIQTIEKRIKEHKNETCPICLDSINKPTHVTCCKQILCFKCITLCLARKPNCPLCRTPLDKKKLLVIDNDRKSPVNLKNKKLPTKLEKIIELITEKKEGKFLVFSSYDASFFNIIHHLIKHKISYKRIMGHPSTIQHAIDNFKRGNIRVLMLNSKNAGNGLNLEMATDIILYHRMTRDMEQQIIGRGQRLGRTSPLHVHYLCHDNETN